MADYQKYLYAIMHPNPSLVASQLEPLEFGKQYSVGTKRFYQGKLLFVEVDPAFRNDYFPIDEYLEKTVAKPDGSPKRTKIISSYRVLEHLDLLDEKIRRRDDAKNAGDQYPPGAEAANGWSGGRCGRRRFQAHPAGAGAGAAGFFGMSAGSGPTMLMTFAVSSSGVAGLMS